MIKVSSNINDVISRTQRLVTQRIPKAMTAALQPGEWKADALAAARAALNTLATPAEQVYVESFVSSAYVALLEGRLVMGMTAPGSSLALVAAQLNIPGLTDERFAELSITDANAEAQLEQSVFDWVNDEKHWDIARDGEKNFENVYEKAQWIMRLMLAPPGSLPTEPSASDTMSPSEARENLLPVVLEYISRTQQETQNQNRLDVVTSRLWLNAVLATWSALVRTQYRVKVKQFLQAA